MVIIIASSIQYEHSNEEQGLTALTLFHLDYETPFCKMIYRALNKKILAKDFVPVWLYSKKNLLQIAT